jgi:hypothetical protein
VLRLPNFFGNVGDDGVRQTLIHTCLSNSLINQDFFFHTQNMQDVRRTGNPQDHDVQSMLGIKVIKTRQTLLPNVLVESLGSVRAGFQFSTLARYRLVVVVTLMEGVCPHQNSGYFFLLF